MLSALPPPHSAGIEEKIAWAVEYYRQRGDRLRKDPRIDRLLTELQSALTASHQSMDKAGVVAACRDCEQLAGGSCCGAGIEDRYDPITLLINLLLGAQLPMSRQATDSCLFLGTEGCQLPARDVICVNYLCREVSAVIDPKRLTNLRAAEGRELETLFALHQYLHRQLQKLAG